MSAVLDWALVDGKPVHAGTFVGIADRPAAVCPCCGEPVVWKAGEVVAPHVAHRPGSLCATTNPETAEHYNAKMRMADLLGARRSVRIATKCRAGHPIVATWNVGMWTRAVPEMRVGNRRPDVVLVKDSDSGNDFEVAAVEVLRSHAVDQEKAEDLAALGLRWVEVTAAVALAWDGESPLPVCNFDGESWIEFGDECGKCREIAEWRKRQSELEEQAKAKRNAFYREMDSRNARFLKAAGLIDIDFDKAKIHGDDFFRVAEQFNSDARSFAVHPPQDAFAVALSMDTNPGRAAMAIVRIPLKEDRRSPQSAPLWHGHNVYARVIGEDVGNGDAAWRCVEHALDLIRCTLKNSAAIWTNLDVVSANYTICPFDEVEGRGRVRRRLDSPRSILFRCSSDEHDEFFAWVKYAKAAAWELLSGSPGRRVVNS